VLRVSKIQAHCFTEAGDCCPYIAIYTTDTFLFYTQQTPAHAYVAIAEELLGERLVRIVCFPNPTATVLSLSW
jgi:hypothetical protein